MATHSAARLVLILLLLPLAYVSRGSGSGSPPGGLPDEEIDRHVEQIDAFVEAGLLARDIPMRPPASDPVFLRRAYLDIAGRIPTMDEARDFLDSEARGKRRQLVRDLLGSEASVSREFNYWADLLRLKSAMNNVPGRYYLDWVKQALRSNMPYDRMVRELIGAEGYIWENGAAGYYLRDQGMELDHLANTFQVFMGTQLVCAQCHDHPYDDFTQMDYYRQAAYIFGVQTTDRSVLQKYRRLNARPASKEESGIDPRVHQRARQLIRPLRHRVHETSRPLRLPQDYQYDDASPRSEVEPAVIFGEAPDASGDGSLRHGYAQWLTSPDNPRFATVIANRLWKRAMGAGLIEPVDDLATGYKPSHPELMERLSGLMVELGFDLRDFMLILYSTRTYQQEAAEEERDPGQGYHFAGRPLQRMSAEQIWDSLMTLLVPDVDLRSGPTPVSRRDRVAISLQGKSVEEILEVAEEQLEQDRVRSRNPARVTAALKASVRGTDAILGLIEQSQKARKKGDRREAARLLSKAQESLAQLRQADGGSSSVRLDSRLKEIIRETEQARKKGDRKELARLLSQAQESLVQLRQADGGSPSARQDSRWKGISREYVRASEISSPAPPRHFLRQFGQSDRETIENANDEANVPQALTLINSQYHASLWRPGSLLEERVAQAAGRREILDVLFLSILSREPTREERRMLAPRLENGRDGAVRDIAWSLLNTQQFLFVQ